MLAVDQERRVLAERVARRIAGYPEVERVIYFGSGARGEADLWSDIDVCYSTRELTDPQKFFLDARIRADLEEAGFALGQEVGRIDLSYVSEEDFQGPSKSSFVENVRRDGRTIWLRE